MSSTLSADPRLVAPILAMLALPPAPSTAGLLPAAVADDGDGPVLPSRGRGDADALRRRLAPVLRLSDEELTRLIPGRSGFRYVGCPDCDGGTQEGQLTWSLDRPEEVRCRFCGLRFPNEQYPDDRVLEVTNPLGEVQAYPYWESPDPPPRSGRSSRRDGEPREGYRYYFRARAWFEARAYFSRAAADLALLYHQTGDASLARRSALILDRFARVYPGYCVRYDYPFQQKRIFPGDAGHPFPVAPFRAAKWSWWAYMDIPEDLIRAYDLLRPAGVIDEPMRRRIEDDFFRAGVAFVLGIEPTSGNMDPTLLRGLVVAGLVLREPAYIHEAVARIDRLVAGQFFADGMWREGATSYHRQTLGGLTILADLLLGYEDPPGYRPPGGGDRIDDLDLASRFPIFARARDIPARLRYPSGRTVAVHDTWAGDRGGPPTDESGPLLLPAFGHARLGRGAGDDQIQAHLHFSGGYGHQHADLLAMTLFARGAERLSDLGYTHTRYRAWTVATLSHNTVMVDGLDQDLGSESRPNDGSLLLYAPVDGDFQAVEASAPRAYPGRIEDYRRLLLLVGLGPDRAYVVDRFRVVGGSRHEYALLGDADHDGAIEVESDLPVEPLGATLVPEGVPIRLPIGESVPGDAGGHNIAYAFVREVDQAPIPGLWAARFTSEAPAAGSLRVHRLSEPGSVAFLGRAPSIRRADEDDARLDDLTMPVLVERREGEDLSSTFLSVFEPVDDRPSLDRVERLPLDEGGPGDVALRVTSGPITDTLLLAGDPSGGRLRSGGLAMRGRLGFVRERSGVVERMTLVGGDRLVAGDRELIGSGTIRGTVAGTLRTANGAAVDGLVVADPLPDPALIRGRTAIMTAPDGFTRGFEVAGAAEVDGRPVLVLADDPGFEVDPDGTSRHRFFPGRVWSGPNRFEIATIATSPGPEAD